MNRILLLMTLLAVVGGTSGRAGVAARGATVGPLAADVRVLGVGPATVVTFRIEIADPSPVPNSVLVQRLDSVGRLIATLGAMRDDGTSGDQVASDRIFSLAVALAPVMEGPMFFRASAAFRGVVGRVASATIVLHAIQADAFESIGPSGGSVRLTTGPFAGSVLTIPAGALSDPVPVSMRVIADPFDPSETQAVLEIRPHGLPLAVPAVLSMPIDSELDNLLRSADGNQPWEQATDRLCGSLVLCLDLDGFSLIRRSNIPKLGRSLCRAVESGTDCSAPWEGAISSPYLPLILVHGHVTDVNLQQRAQCGWGNAQYFGDLPRMLAELGFDVWLFLYDTAPSMGLTAPLLAAQVQRVLDATGRDRVTIAGYSQGGIVARKFVQTVGEGKAARLITVGTPHLGVSIPLEFDDVLGCDAGREQDLGGSDEMSDFLRALNEEPAPELSGPSPDYVLAGGQALALSLLHPFGCQVDTETDRFVLYRSAIAEGEFVGNRLGLPFEGYKHSTFPDGTPCPNRPLNFVAADETDHLTFLTIAKWAALPVGPAPPPPPADYLAYWPLNGSAQNATGSSHGTLHNGVAPAADRHGNASGALSFDGVNDYVSIGQLHPSTTAFTVSVWVKPGKYLTNSGYQLENQIVGDAGNYQGYRLYQHGTSLSFQYQNPAFTYRTATIQLGPADTQRWTHLVGVYDGGAVVLYRDGDAVAGAAGGGPIARGFRNLEFGRDPNVQTSHWQGLMDELRIYDRALTPGEVRALAGRQ